MELKQKFKGMLTLVIASFILVSCINNSKDKSDLSQLSTKTLEDSFIKFTFENKEIKLDADAVTNKINSFVITGVSNTSDFNIQISMMNMDYQNLDPFKESNYIIENNKSKTGTTINIYKGKTTLYVAGLICSATNGEVIITKITNDFVEGTFSCNAKENSVEACKNGKFLSLTNGSFKCKLRNQ